ncbi:hypothetical protein D9M73_203420 [compost metagenome]
MADRVAGETAYTEHLSLGFGVVADAGNVGLTEAVDLGRPDHCVTAPAPHAFEYSFERHVTRITRNVVATRAQRDRFFDQERLAVGHQQFRAVGQFGQAGAQARDHAQARGNHLAIATPGLGGGDDHQFSQGEITGCRHAR